MSDQSRHVSLERMADFTRGILSSSEQQAIASHTRICERCAADLARIERLVAVAGDDTSEDVPSYVVARALRLMRQRNASQPLVRRRLVMAALRFDSLRTPLAHGKRAQQAGVRQMVFQAEHLDIDVRIKAAGHSWMVTGQVLSWVASGQVELQGQTTVQAQLNRLGEFMLPAVPSGNYLLTLLLDDLEIGMKLDIGG